LRKAARLEKGADMLTNKKAATSGKARAASRLHNALNFISTSATSPRFSVALGFRVRG